jgi:hypothetical protein
MFNFLRSENDTLNETEGVMPCLQEDANHGTNGTIAKLVVLNFETRKTSIHRLNQPFRSK